jgi:hypothetical protein
MCIIYRYVRDVQFEIEKNIEFCQAGCRSREHAESGHLQCCITLSIN